MKKVVPVYSMFPILSIFMVATSLFLVSPAFAWRAFSMRDIEKTLAEPQVKLLAVEFYANWCAPCKKESPKWKQLESKYRNYGLRVWVISVRPTASEACDTPDWNPDRIICDEDGEIQERWEANRLPQAFLWSWQGDLLVEHGNFEEVESVIKQYFKNSPRILIDMPTDEKNVLWDKGAALLKREVRSEFKRLSKFIIVADERESRVIAAHRKNTYNLRYDDSMHCVLGEEISPNSVLKIMKITNSSGEEYLILELFSLEKGCLEASVKVPYSDYRMQESVVEAVTGIIKSLQKEPTKPGEKQVVKGRDTNGENPVSAQEKLNSDVETKGKNQPVKPTVIQQPKHELPDSVQKFDLNSFPLLVSDMQFIDFTPKLMSISSAGVGLQMLSQRADFFIVPLELSYMFLERYMGYFELVLGAHKERDTHFGIQELSLGFNAEIINQKPYLLSAGIKMAFYNIIEGSWIGCQIIHLDPYFSFGMGIKNRFFFDIYFKMTNFMQITNGYQMMLTLGTPLMLRIYNQLFLYNQFEFNGTLLEDTSALDDRFFEILYTPGLGYQNNIFSVKFGFPLRIYESQHNNFYWQFILNAAYYY